MEYLTLDKQIWLQLNYELRLNNPVFKLWTVNKYILKKVIFLFSKSQLTQNGSLIS